MPDYQGLFIKELDEGKDERICYMSHNSYWPIFQIINQRYENSYIDIFGGATSYLRGERLHDDYNIILLSSSFSFCSYELEVMKQMASEISILHNKRVTVGYLSFIPIPDRTDPNITMVLHLASMKDGDWHLEESSIENTDDRTDDNLLLLDFILSKHNELENQKVIKK